MMERDVKEYFRCFIRYINDQSNCTFVGVLHSGEEEENCTFVGVLHSGEEEEISHATYDKWFWRKALEDEIKLIEMRREFNDALKRSGELLKSC